MNGTLLASTDETPARSSQEELLAQIVWLRQAVEGLKLKDRLFGKKSEKKSKDRSNHRDDPQDSPNKEQRKRGGPKGGSGRGRRDYSHLPAEEEFVEELTDARVRAPCRKVLESLQVHWTGLTLFVDDRRIPMDNNASERKIRGPALGRKNYYGSGALWSGRLSAMMFSIFATLKHWKINPRRWLLWYLNDCAVSGGKAPPDIRPFLPWNLAPDQLASLRTADPRANPPNA